MNFTNKKLGIWGLGISGKAAVAFLRHKPIQLSIMDRRNPDQKELELLQKNNISFFNENSLEQFFEHNDTVLVSPGINHPACHLYKNKLICELDLFCANFKKPIISVTGTVGKTTVVSLLSQLLKQSMQICTGGNIGIGMLDLIKKEKISDAALLELSSFQLEHAKTFAPDLAIWTNFYPNHLDWHGSQNAYFNAKQNVIRNQKAGQKALIPLTLFESLIPLHKKDVKWYLFSPEKPSSRQKNLINQHIEGIFYIHKNRIVFEHDKYVKPLCNLKQFPEITFLENWLIIYATLHLLGKNFSADISKKVKLDIPKHRLEKVATINGIDFYNDSKSTTPAATLAAIAKLRNRPIILFLGGISKGINRAIFFEKIKNSVKMIICFGKERTQLEQLCYKYNRKYQSFEKLGEAFYFCTKIAQSGDQILFSPAGASFDQFSDYKKRGTYFKNLVKRHRTLNN